MATSTKLPKMASGQRYGRLVAIKFTGRGNRGGALWLLKCDCGQEHETFANWVRTGKTKSCGCLRLENTKRMGASTATHGMTGTPTHVSWERMHSRCNNPNSDRYYDYGGRGIRVCDRWRKFENFFSDMGERPSLDYSLDRINNAGNYEPSNCRWATAKEQALNRRHRRVA